jgi:hypothetical protein
MANWMKRNGVHGYVNTSENGYLGLSETGHPDLFQAEHPGPRGAGGNYTQYSPRPGQMVQSGSVAPRAPQPQQVQYSNQGQRNTDQKRKMGILGPQQASAPTAPPVRSTTSPLPSIQAQGPVENMSAKAMDYLRQEKNPTVATTPVAAVRRSGGGGSRRSASRPLNEANLNPIRGQVTGGVEDSGTRTSRATTPGTQSNADRAAAFGRSAVVRAGWDGQAAGMSRPGTNSTEVGRGTTSSQVSDWVRAGTPGRDRAGDLLFSPVRTISNAISGRETAGQAAEQRAELTQGARTYRDNHRAAGWARGAANIGLDVAETALTVSGASSLAGGAARMLPRVAAAGGARRVLGALAGEVGTAATNAVAENGLRATARTAATNTARWAAPHAARAVAAGVGGEAVSRGVASIGDSDNRESARVWGATGRDAGATAAIGLLSGMYRAPRPAAPSRGLPSGGVSPRGLPSGGGGSPPVSRGNAVISSGGGGEARVPAPSAPARAPAASSAPSSPFATASAPSPRRAAVSENAVPAPLGTTRAAIVREPGISRSVMGRRTSAGRLPLETNPGPSGYTAGTRQNPHGRTPQGIGMRTAAGSGNGPDTAAPTPSVPVASVDPGPAPSPRGARPASSGAGTPDPVRPPAVAAEAPEVSISSGTGRVFPGRLQEVVSPRPRPFRELATRRPIEGPARGPIDAPVSSPSNEDLGIPPGSFRTEVETRRMFSGPGNGRARVGTSEAPVSMSATDVTDRVSTMIDAPALTKAQKAAATRARKAAEAPVSGNTVIGATPGRGRDWRKGQTGPAGGTATRAPEHTFLGGVTHGMLSSSPGGGMTRGGENPPQPSTNHGFGRSNVRI